MNKKPGDPLKSLHLPNLSHSKSEKIASFKKKV